jgi:type VI secretion system secreted protein VgrG
MPVSRSWDMRADVHCAAGTRCPGTPPARDLLHAFGRNPAFAGNGPCRCRHTDQLDILADKAITVISVNDAIEIKAKEKIVIQAGQSAITLEGGNITFACPGNFTVKGGQHLFDKGGRRGANLEMLPGERQTEDHWIALSYLDPETAEGIAGTDYEIHLEKGGVLTGTLDSRGKAHHDNVLNKPVQKIIYKPRSALKEEPAAALEKIMGA